MTVIIECGYEPEHTHEYPDDWTFGGANECDPRADPRWKPTTYEYFDDQLRRIWQTQVPICDDAALDYFTNVASRGAGWNPVWIAAIRPDERGAVMLPFTYNKTEDTVYPTED